MNAADKKIIYGLKRAKHSYVTGRFLDEIEENGLQIQALQEAVGMTMDKIPAHVEHLEEVLKEIGLEHWITGNYSLAELRIVQDAIKSALLK